MTLKRKMNSPEDEEYWEFVDRTAKKVETYPAWKRGGDNVKLSGEEEPKRNPSEITDPLPNYKLS